MILKAKPAAVFSLALLAVAGIATTPPARAQYFSNKDGYAADGTPKLQVELDPYAWWPGVGGSVHLASPIIDDRRPGSFNTGLFSWSFLRDVLHFAFMGDGVVRYGPFSGEIDMQYLSVSESQTLFTGPRGDVFRVNTAVQLTRVAPGVGYQVYTGAIGGIPVSFDARAGFAFLTTSQTYTGEAALTGLSSSNNTSFVQPWLGGRADFILTPQWRIELGAQVSGFGVSGGAWGWGASGAVSYAVNDWCTLNLGARAIETERFGDSNTAAGSRRSLSLVVYGPLFGVGFRF
jgi:hypothetical protein